MNKKQISFEKLAQEVFKCVPLSKEEVLRNNDGKYILFTNEQLDKSKED